jgi:hypothetical protein
MNDDARNREREGYQGNDIELGKQQTQGVLAVHMWTKAS